MPLAPAANTLQGWATGSAGERVIRTVVAGALFASLFSTVDIVTLTLLGHVFDPLQITLILVRGIIFGSDFPVMSPPVSTMIFAHFAGAVVAGVIGGLLLPMFLRPFGAVLAGTLVAIPYHAAAAGVLNGSFREWPPGAIGAVVVVSVLVGGSLGYVAWEAHDLDSRVKAPPHESPKRRKFRIWQP